MWSSDPAARLALGLRADAAPGIRWEGYLLNESGYGEEGRAYALGLARRGHDVGVLTANDVPGFLRTLPEADAELLARLCSRPPRPDDLVVQNFVPDWVDRRPVGGYQVARTMFETDGLPAKWLPKLALVDEVWVPTEFNVTSFRDAGVRVPVHVVPAGVDTDLYRPGAEPLPLSRTAGTVFLSVASPITRKGWDVLLRAWARAFDASDDVLLVLKVTGTPDRAAELRDSTVRWVEQRLAELGRGLADCAPVLVHADHVPTADMPRLYAAADACVAPSRGEGYGRTLMEAMACALPVIATGWSGITSFVDDSNGLLIEVDGLSVIGQDEPVDAYWGQRWAVPCVRSLVDHLRWVADDRARAQRLGAAARADVVARWTWDAALDVVESRVEEIRLRQRRRPAVPGTTRLRWQGDQFATHSLSVVNREVAARLVTDARLDVELHSREVDPDPDLVARAPQEVFQSTGHLLDGSAHVTVRHQWPPDWSAPAEGAFVAIQPWEFGAVPREWAEGTRGVDEVWCYSQWVRQAYVLGGVPAEKVHVVPLGVDHHLFTPEGPRFPLDTRKGTRLLFCGGAIARKGIDVLIAAYCAAFGPDDDVCLVIKAHGTRTSYAGNSVVDQLHAVAANPQAPAIEIIDEDLTPQQLAALYRSCDVLVHPYRGEGFALPVAEAMASGLPVVVTEHGATSDFCDAEDAYLIPAELVPLPQSGFGPTSGSYFWAEPDREALTALLREVVADRAGRAVKARAGRERILGGFTWARVARTVAERITALGATVPVRERPVPELQTRSGRTVLHAPDWDHFEDDTVVREYLRRFGEHDDVCLVVPVAADPSAVARAVSLLETLTEAVVPAGEAGPELLLVPTDGAGQERLRTLVRCTTDEVSLEAVDAVGV